MYHNYNNVGAFKRRTERREKRRGEKEGGEKRREEGGKNGRGKRDEKKMLHWESNPEPFTW